jgi:hypothetical protein
MDKSSRINSISRRTLQWSEQNDDQQSEFTVQPTEYDTQLTTDAIQMKHPSVQLYSSSNRNGQSSDSYERMSRPLINDKYDDNSYNGHVERSSTDDQFRSKTIVYREEKDNNTYQYDNRNKSKFTGTNASISQRSTRMESSTTSAKSVSCIIDISLGFVNSNDSSHASVTHLTRLSKDVAHNNIEKATVDNVDSIDINISLPNRTAQVITYGKQHL